MSLFATKHFVPILGMDMHMITLPLGVMSLIPHPFIGYVFDPNDNVPGGSTVSVNGVPIARHITVGALNTQQHIPIGGSFTNPAMIAHEAVVFYGDSTVFADGESVSGSAYQVMTCDDMGIPLPGRKGLYTPNSSLIVIPSPKPVFVSDSIAPGISSSGSSSSNEFPMTCLEEHAVTGSSGSTAVASALVSEEQLEENLVEEETEEEEEGALADYDFSV